MNFLLTGINAKYIHSNPAIYSLAAYTKQFNAPDGTPYREQVQIAEYTINQNIEDILADIYMKKPDVIGFSCYIWNISMVEKLIVNLHRILPELPIWLGGPEVSFHCEKMMEKYPFLTGIMIGEGEATLKEILDAYATEEPGKAQADAFETIPGICTRKGYTVDRPCMDLNEIPFFYDNLENFENRIIYYESSRGCPFRCKYCLSSIEKNLRFRNIDTVKRELQFFLDKKIPQVKFIDRTFNAKKDHSKAIWTYIKEHDNGVTNFHFEVSADLLDEEEIALLKSLRPGLVQLEIGVQSTNPNTIKAINRTMDLVKLKRNVDSLNEAGNVHLHLDLIAGLPHEDYVSFGKSFDDVYAMKPEQLQLGFLKILKGSMMEEQVPEYGIAYREEPPYEVLFTNDLSYEDVIKLKQVEAMVELFYNSGQFAHTISFLQKRMGSAFSLYEKLGAFYQKKGLLTMLSRRLAHYENLLEFVKENDPACEEIYVELLTFDAYLRENNKSRPGFSKDMEPYKNTIRERFQLEEEERKILPHYEGYDYKQMMKMTHVEFFKYTVWDKEIKETKEQAVLFDYRRRNPVTNSCEIILW